MIKGSLEWIYAVDYDARRAWTKSGNRLRDGVGEFFWTDGELLGFVDDSCSYEADGRGGGGGGKTPMTLSLRTSSCICSRRREM